MDKRKIAEERRYRNRWSKTNEGIDPNADRIGVAGEVAAMRELGIEGRPQSAQKTPGYQFVVNGITVKVATSETPGHLLVKEGKVNADLYILAAYRLLTDDAALIGWTDAATVLSFPARNLSKGRYGLMSHAVPIGALWSITEVFDTLSLDRPERFGMIDVPVVRKPEPVDPLKQGTLFPDVRQDRDW